MISIKVFTTKNCEPCKVFLKDLHRRKANPAMMAGRYEISVFPCEDCPDLVEKFGISAGPTVIAISVDLYGEIRRHRMNGYSPKLVEDFWRFCEAGEEAQETGEWIERDGNGEPTGEERLLWGG